ncbi:hypothetical protein PanWU01x14_339210 [Parasponia andersonii]|uniref:Uncharacterized protein n=1 Tax=Parasponia andersonii TaxID=3476 RepID=A0A2P5AEX3_PARAD|nr:hypothetical protein PanWU01x14_339210 [Parasponia andersonii]
MQTSPRRGKLKKSLSSQIPHQTSLKPSFGNAKWKLVDDLGGGEALTKRGQCITAAGFGESLYIKNLAGLGLQDVPESGLLNRN